MELVGVASWIPQNQPRRLEFTHKFSVGLPPETLWNFLEVSFENSNYSPIWPHSISQARSPGLSLWESVELNYKLLWWHKTAHYRVEDFVRGRLVTLRAQHDHPLKGSESIEVKENPTGAQLNWQGKYETEHAGASEYYFKYYFENAFFKELSSKLSQVSTRPH